MSWESRLEATWLGDPAKVASLDHRVRSVTSGRTLSWLPCAPTSVEILASCIRRLGDLQEWYLASGCIVLLAELVYGAKRGGGMPTSLGLGEPTRDLAWREIRHLRNALMHPANLKRDDAPQRWL